MEYPTFHAAAVALGVARDDREWEYCLQEAVGFKSAQQLRHLFAILLLWCTPSEPANLFMQFQEVGSLGGLHAHMHAWIQPHTQM